ncbi:MAG TPA: response regulator [Bryobacteraceae bacterium]|nr:response regulator [Bryobacteraceae bacterium]
MARVLVVEDDAQQLGMRCMVLRAAGHEVTAAQSPAAAIDSFRDHRPDIVVMDLRLPRISDGEDLLRGLGPDARVLVLTGAALQTPPLGAARVLKKPCSSQVLLRAIAEMA